MPVLPAKPVNHTLECNRYQRTRRTFRFHNGGVGIDISAPETYVRLTFRLDVNSSPLLILDTRDGESSTGVTFTKTGTAGQVELVIEPAAWENIAYAKLKFGCLVCYANGDDPVYLVGQANINAYPVRKDA